VNAAAVSGARTPGSKRGRWALRVLGGVLAAALWVVCAQLLWHSSVPSNLPHVHIDPRSFFSASFLRSSSHYEAFLELLGAGSAVVLLIVLWLYSRHGHRLMGESAAGRVGTGMLLGMLGFAVVWLAQLPFGLLAVWWERRHHVSHQGYAAAVLDSFLGLGDKFLFVCLALAVAMGLAGLTRRWWWALAAPVFVGLALLSTYTSVYLIPATHSTSRPLIVKDERRLARIEGVPGTKLLVQEVHRYTTDPDAESVGFGATKALILWDTLLDGRFSRAEVDVVMGHELGHLAHHHPLKRVGWLALELIPLAALVAWVTRRRGGMYEPRAVPLALFVFVAAQLALTPLQNVVYRRQEAEADYSALRATRDPTAARKLFVNLAVTSKADPDPPTWAFLLYDDHPSIVQRIAMVQAWRQVNSP
jgi:STE24 endopeptidase